MREKKERRQTDRQIGRMRDSCTDKDVQKLMPLVSKSQIDNGKLIYNWEKRKVK